MIGDFLISALTRIFSTPSVAKVYERWEIDLIDCILLLYFGETDKATGK